MFGYIIVNKSELKFKEFDLYRSFYCGFCRELKRSYGKRGQITLSYDLTFLIILLTSLYEPEPDRGFCKCAVHPLEKHETRINPFSKYAADMNMLLAYYKCEDDWLDEGKVSRRCMKQLLKKPVKKISRQYPKKVEIIKTNLEKIRKCEQENHQDVDKVAGYFGQIMAQIFTVYEDEWYKTLERMGFFLGKFIYLMDAYEDVERDLKKGNYNPFSELYQSEDFEEKCENILSMMMAECCKAFEKLPLIWHAEILRNILYSGVWCRYKMIKQKRGSGNEKSL